MESKGIYFTPATVRRKIIDNVYIYICVYSTHEHGEQKQKTVIFTKRRVKRFHAVNSLSTRDITRPVNSFKFLPSSCSPPHFSFPACPLNIAGERLTNQAIFHTSRWCFAKRNETSTELSLSLSLFSFFLSPFLRRTRLLGQRSKRS